MAVVALPAAQSRSSRSRAFSDLPSRGAAIRSRDELEAIEHEEDDEDVTSSHRVLANDPVLADRGGTRIPGLFDNRRSGETGRAADPPPRFARRTLA
jgi:hypothetical protein